MTESVVHEPELFEAVIKAYHIDTSDFVINTAHNIRSGEGNHNQWEHVAILYWYLIWGRLH